MNKGLLAESIAESRAKAKQRYPKSGLLQDVEAIKGFSGTLRKKARKKIKKKVLSGISKIFGG